jgi:tetrapyrrole methylase family protein/MazG family protein
MGVQDRFSRLYEIIVTLRSPDGCPWDREQTARSLRANLLEEAYECVEAIEHDDSPHVCEELGDVLLLLLMIARIYEEQQFFTIGDVLGTISEKLIRRHPHVFGESAVSSTEEVVAQWDEIKRDQEGRQREKSVLDGVSKALPPLERAYELQRKASKIGFDWSSVDGVLSKLEEEIAEVRQCLHRESGPHRQLGAPDAASADTLEAEVGDLLFSTCNVARYLGTNPSLSLNRANRKFIARFAIVEQEMKARGREMSKESLAEMDSIWESTKESW